MPNTADGVGAAGASAVAEEGAKVASEVDGLGEQLKLGSSPQVLDAAHQRAVFALIALTLLMIGLDSTIISPALATIDRDLHATTNWGGWTITAFTLASLAVMPLAGKLSDQYGRRRIFATSVAIFTAASVICGFATDIYMLIVMRFVQAIGGGAILPSAVGVASDLFGRNRDRVIGAFGTILPIGYIIGPLFGGLFVRYWTWRGIFFVNVPIGIVFLLLVFRFLPASTRRVTGRVDVRGLSLFVVLVFAAMIGITTLGDGHVEPWDLVFVGPMVVFVLLSAIFLRHARRAQAPLIPLRLLTGKGFGPLNVINFCYGAAVITFSILLPLYAHTRFHMGSVAAGSLISGEGITQIVFSFLGVAVLRRSGFRLPMFAGFVVLVIGVGLAGMTPVGLGPYAWLFWSATIAGIGAGFTFPASMNAMLQVAAEDAAAITGLRNMFRLAGMIVGISIVTSIVARAADPGIAQAHSIIACALLVVLTMPLLFLIPDHKGSW